MFADRVKNITASGIRKVFDLATKMENPINFSIGQPDFDAPDPIKEAAIAAIKEGKNKYTVTQGIDPLRKVILDDLEKYKNYKPEDLFISSGVSGGLLLSMLVLVNPGDEVIIPDPYFVIYKHHINLCGAVPKYYELYPDFQIKPEKIKELITDKTKLLILNSPSNPTGRVFPKKEIQEIAEIAKEKGIIVLSDEIYDKFVYDVEHHSIATYYPKTILLGGFSKSYGIPGWRLGYVAGPGEILEKMKTLQQFSYVCAPSVLQYGCLKIPDVSLLDLQKAYKKKRDMIYEGLKKIGYDVEKPEGSFYIFPKIPWGTDKEFFECAVKHNMLIIPGSAFSKYDQHFRISFAVSDEIIEKGLGILEKIYKKP